MDKSLTPQEAFADFWENTGRHISPSPDELRKAKQTMEGRQLKKGKVMHLGVERVARLLDKYAPGQYRLNEPTFTKVEG
jgi:hypothetical protein